MNGHQAQRRRQRVASDRAASLDRLSEPPTQPQLATVLDTGRTVCGSSSVYEIAGVYLSLCLSVCLSVCPILRHSRGVTRAAGLLLWHRGQAISIDCCRTRMHSAAAAGAVAFRSISTAARRSAANAISVMVTATYDAEHRLCLAKAGDRIHVLRSVVLLLTLLLVPLMGLLQLRFEHDSSTIRARFGYNTLRDAYDSSAIRARCNILRGVMCFRAIMNMSILLRCCRML